MATAKSEGKTSLFDVIANEEALWTYQNSLIVITPSCSSNWARAIGAISSKRINTTVILLDSQTFGANSDSSETIRDLLQSGIPTHLVQKGDDLESVFPSKLTASHGSHVQNTAADEEDEAA
jgi:kynureninase